MLNKERKSPKNGEEIKSIGIYKNLEAAKNDQIYEMSFKKIYFDDPYALEGQLDLIVETLLASNEN